jgi:hypothetical protein
MTLAISLLCALLSTWLLVAVGVDVRMASRSLRNEVVRQRTLVDDMIEHSLALALFQRDYGEVQDLLSHYVAAGHFSQAVVVNNQRQVVASLGAAGNLEVGRPLPASVLSESRKVPLALHSEALGELLARVPPTIAEKFEVSDKYADQLYQLSIWLCALAWLCTLGLVSWWFIRR